MSSSKKKNAPETLSPARNFTLRTEDRVRAVAAGPPAFVRRLRAIEDLEEGIVRVLVERCRHALGAGTAPAELAAHAQASAPMRAFDRLNDLVERHNRYYPIEANLPIQPRTGELMDRSGEPWRPMPRRSLDELVARALARLDTDD
jgi:hypothetical protein